MLHHVQRIDELISHLLTLLPQAQQVAFFCGERMWYMLIQGLLKLGGQVEQIICRYSDIGPPLTVAMGIDHVDLPCPGHNPVREVKELGDPSRGTHLNERIQMWDEDVSRKVCTRLKLCGKRGDATAGTATSARLSAKLPVDVKG